MVGKYRVATSSSTKLNVATLITNLNVAID